MDLVMESRHEGPATVVEVSGEVDMFTAPKLREHLVGLVDEGNHRIVADLQGVSFIDSTGLGTLVGVLKRVNEVNGSLALVCTNRTVLRVLGITGLDKIFALHETVEAALRGSAEA